MYPGKYISFSYMPSKLTLYGTRAAPTVEAVFIGTETGCTWNVVIL